MEQVLQKFKNLYAGENAIKRHGLYLLLLILPAMISSLQYMIDKDAPKEILILGMILFGILAMVEIIPYFLLLGFQGEFYESRINNEVGLPKLNFGMLLKGVKIFCITLVWSIYATILCTIFLILPIVGLIGGLVANKGASSSDPWTFIGIILIILALYLVFIVALLILAPFLNYIIFSFVEDYEFRGEYFNPMTLVKLIKKVFKPTMITFLKFLLAALIVGMITSTVTTIVIVIAGIGGVTASALSDPNTANPEYSAISLFVILPICTIGTLFTTYASGMVQFAATDAYADIYKQELRLPDPLENKEEKEEEQQQPENQNNDNWVE